MKLRDLVTKQLDIDEIGQLLPGYPVIPETPPPGMALAFARLTETRVLTRLVVRGVPGSQPVAELVRGGQVHQLDASHGGDGFVMAGAFVLDTPIMLMAGDQLQCQDALAVGIVTGTAYWMDVRI